jgi:hypothetical protein
MVIGVDFDNTIVCYDELFHRIAVEQGLIPADVPATKGRVREFLRRHGKEEDWTRLQGYVYGARMLEAPAFPGALDFFADCVREGVRVCIISHRTRYPYQGPPYDLHLTARQWLTDHGFFDPGGIGLSVERVYFDVTKQEKFQRIVQVGCTHFIDDLPEFLGDPMFPPGVTRILFSPGTPPCTDSHTRWVSSWNEAASLLLRNGAPRP